MVFPFDAVKISPGLMPVPLIMFSQAATMKWTCIYKTLSLKQKEYYGIQLLKVGVQNDQSG